MKEKNKQETKYAETPDGRRICRLGSGLGKLNLVFAYDVRRQPNDPKLSHGANKSKRGFAQNRKIKEQPPLAPARC
jgi:hypothetical protein